MVPLVRHGGDIDITGWPTWAVVLLVGVPVLVGALRLYYVFRGVWRKRTPSERDLFVPPVSAPGWYPDPVDPDLVRWYDGRVWTSATERR